MCTIFGVAHHHFWIRNSALMNSVLAREKSHFERLFLLLYGRTTSLTWTCISIDIQNFCMHSLFSNCLCCLFFASFSTLLLLFFFSGMNVHTYIYEFQIKMCTGVFFCQLTVQLWYVQSALRKKQTSKRWHIWKKKNSRKKCARQHENCDWNTIKICAESWEKKRGKKNENWNDRNSRLNNCNSLETFRRNHLHNMMELTLYFIDSSL